MAPCNTKGALILLWRHPATNVVVFQWPQGALPISGLPGRSTILLAASSE